MAGFGWNFYGFFLFCIVWIGAYFVWAGSMARREERLRPERGGGADRGEAVAPSESERGWGPASARKSRLDSNP
ncbi:MAG: hypothetical protein ACRD1S_18545 [Vicinamibacterales bacterium]